MEGTPKSLREAIKLGLGDPPPSYLDGLDTEDRIYYSVKDFLANKFSAEVIRHQSIENLLMRLYKRLTD